MPWDAVKGISFFLGKCEARRLRSRRVVAESLLLAYAQALDCLTHGPANLYCGPRKPV